MENTRTLSTETVTMLSKEIAEFIIYEVDDAFEELYHSEEKTFREDILEQELEDDFEFGDEASLQKDIEKLIQTKGCDEVADYLFDWASGEAFFMMDGSDYRMEFITLSASKICEKYKDVLHI